MKFKLLRGAHRVGPQHDSKGVMVQEPRTYHAQRDRQPIVESDTDLVKKLGPEKFQRVDESVEATDEDEDDVRKELEQLNKGDLIARAEEEEVEFSHSDTKAEIIQKMMSHYES